MLVSALVLWHFHDRFWYASDEGIYANQAERVASGETLNLQVQDLHPGYGTFLNAAALRLFGPDLVSMRYPLVAAALLQSFLAFLLLARRSVPLAATAAVATSALGVVQFLNPTPNWYCLTLAFVLAHWMYAFPRNDARRLIGAGFWVGIVALLRQLSGVWLGMAVVLIALLDTPEVAARRSRVGKSALAVLLLLIPAILIAAKEDEPGGVVLFAIWPVVIIVAAMKRVRLGDRDAIVALLQLAAGAALAAAPLLFHVLAHGAAAAWFSDTFTTALHLSDIVGEKRWGPWYAALTMTAADQAVRSFDLIKILNGVYWAVLTLLGAVNGVLVFRALRRDEDASELVLPIIAAFFSLVSLFMQNPIYLYFTAGLTLTAVLWMIGRARIPVRALWGGVTLLLTGVALACHAAQPYTRTSLQLLEGHRTSTEVVDCAIPRCGLRLDPADIGPYRQLVALIQRDVPPGAPIAAFPSDAQLYFLSDRPNPFRFYNAAIGVQSDADVNEAVAIIHREAPRILTFRPKDKYSREGTRAIVARVRPRYEHVATIAGVEVYRLKKS